MNYHSTLVSPHFLETAVNWMARVDISDWYVHESATSCICILQTGMPEHTRGTLKQHDSSSKSLKGIPRCVNEEHIEDNEVNIGVMDPQCNHLASGCWHKVFRVFLFTLCLVWNSKNNGFDHFCCFGKGWTIDAAHFWHTNFTSVLTWWCLYILFSHCTRQKNNRHWILFTILKTTYFSGQVTPCSLVNNDCPLSLAQAKSKNHDRGWFLSENGVTSKAIFP